MLFIILQYYRCFGVLKRRLPVLSKGITVNLSNTQAIIVACAVMHNICIDMHDEVPNDLCEEHMMKMLEKKTFSICQEIQEVGKKEIG